MERKGRGPLSKPFPLSVHFPSSHTPESPGRGEPMVKGRVAEGALQVIKIALGRLGESERERAVCRQDGLELSFLFFRFLL